MDNIIDLRDHFNAVQKARGLIPSTPDSLSQQLLRSLCDQVEKLMLCPYDDFERETAYHLIDQAKEHLESMDAWWPSDY